MRKRVRKTQFEYEASAGDPASGGDSTAMAGGAVGMASVPQAPIPSSASGPLLHLPQVGVFRDMLPHFVQAKKHLLNEYKALVVMQYLIQVAESFEDWLSLLVWLQQVDALRLTQQVTLSQAVQQKVSWGEGG